mmetsp:Transcript_88492/g.233268  ORF Transcript_88492/g.233268 Transcript_88492/m.233268 type:complete len:297 (-) Transcript_88492:6-896(-)
MAESTKEDRRANQVYERMDTMWQELEAMAAFAKEQAVREKEKAAKEKKESALAPATRDSKISIGSRGGPPLQYKKDEWDRVEESTFGEAVGEKVEKHLVSCCKPLPCDVKLLQILGEEGEGLLNDDYERIFEYFRNKHMRLDRQFISNRRRGKGDDDDSADRRSTSNNMPEGKAKAAPAQVGLSASMGRRRLDTGAGAGAGAAAGAGATAGAAAQASGTGKNPLRKRFDTGASNPEEPSPRPSGRGHVSGLVMAVPVMQKLARNAQASVAARTSQGVSLPAIASARADGGFSPHAS